MSGLDPPVRRCARCGAHLTRQNQSALCAPCGSPRSLREPPAVPREFWDAPEMRSALATWHMGRVILAYRHHPWHQQVLKQSVVGNWFGLTQTQLSRIENGRAPEEMSKLVRWAKLLAIPPELLWFKMPGDSSMPLAGARVVAGQRAEGLVRSAAARGLLPDTKDAGRALSEVNGGAIQFSQCSAREALDVMTWITRTNASDDAIEELGRTAVYLAEAHTRMPAAKILPEVLGVHRAAHAFLRTGRQRLSQTRELLRIDSALLAHACVLLGDLGRYEEARAYGSAALACAQESETDEGLAWTAMAKTARWQDRFAEAAGLAARGFEASGQASVRAELAYREANAIALFGDTPRARAALQKAGKSAEGLGDTGTSAWSFSRGRQAIFTLSVCIHTCDPDGALRAAAEADAYWDVGGGKVTATWAQVRAGAAMAHLLKDAPDGAAGQLDPVLELPPDQRISTVTGYLDEIDAMLQGRRFAGSPIAVRLRDQIREFNAAGMAAGRGS